MKNQFIDGFAAGDKVDDIFMLSEKNLARKRDGNNYLNMTFSDQSGRIKGVMWDQVDEVVGSVSSGDFVHITGHIAEYRDMLQMVVKAVEVCSVNSIEPADFLPASNRDVNKMFDRMLQITDSIQSKYIKRLFQAFWDDKDFVNNFKSAPAAKKVHHAYVGGLLEHSLSMAYLAEKIAEHSFPQDQALLLKHIIVSHHGSREFGSPEPPKTIEAVLVNYIDEIDSKINGIREFMGSEESTENWTSFHRLWGRHFFIGEKGK